MATLVLLMMRRILSQVMLPAMTMIPMLWVVMPQQIFGTPLCSVSLVLSLSTTFILLLELITGPQTLSNGHGQSQKGMILDWVNSYAHICVLFTAFNSKWETLTPMFLFSRLENWWRKRNWIQTGWQGSQGFIWCCRAGVFGWRDYPMYADQPYPLA